MSVETASWASEVDLRVFGYVQALEIQLDEYLKIESILALEDPWLPAAG